MKEIEITVKRIEDMQTLINKRQFDESIDNKIAIKSYEEKVK